MSGIEGTTPFGDDPDRVNPASRLAAVMEQGAWALLPIHAHLLFRTGARPLALDLRVGPQNVYRAALARLSATR